MVWLGDREIKEVGKTYNIRTGILGGKNLAGLGGGNLEFGNDGHGLDFGSPGELDVVADAVGRRRGLDARVDTAGGGGEDLTEGNLSAGGLLGGEGLEVGADKATEEGGADVVGVALCKFLSVFVAQGEWECK